jgi:glycyl-tRNA synthetase beta chain
VTAVVPEKTFAEVVNLVEWPTVAAGSFDEEFLEVPREVLENAMESHQRYFPLEDAGKSLLPRFVVAHNGDPARTDEIVSGHERVIRARLSDAAFFYREDLHRSLEARVAELDSIVFQERLGSLKAKSERVEQLAERLAEMVGASSDVAAFAARAGHLCKADLVTNVVVEFPALQGVMGRYYALASGEEPAVADAILEHYQPRFAGDEVPPSLAGQLVAVADKLDTIVGIFAAGLAPTGSADPYALRRSSIGILQMLLGGLRLTLTEAIVAALDGYEGVLAVDAESVGSAVREFILGRFDVVLRERGNAYDTVAAVLAVAADDPFDAGRRADSLTTFRSASDDMEDLSVAFTRAKNLAQPALGTETDASIMGADERTLADALDDAEARIDVLMEQEAYSAVLETFAAMRPAIDAFFDNVLVMDEDKAPRENRLKLLNRFVALFQRFADFSQLSG